MSVLKACLDYHNISASLPGSLCTVKESRIKLPNLRDHQLSTVCDYFDISLDHHEALSDARAAAKIALTLE